MFVQNTILLSLEEYTVLWLLRSSSIRPNFDHTYTKLRPNFDRTSTKLRPNFDTWHLLHINTIIHMPKVWFEVYSTSTKLRPNFDQTSTPQVSKFGRSFDQTSTPTSFKIYYFLQRINYIFQKNILHCSATLQRKSLVVWKHSLFVWIT